VQTDFLKFQCRGVEEARYAENPLTELTPVAEFFEHRQMHDFGEVHKSGKK